MKATPSAPCWARLKPPRKKPRGWVWTFPRRRNRATPTALPRADGNGSRNRVQPTVRGLPVPANAAGASYLSPRLKARMHELGLSAADLAGIAGSGAAGRVTVEDFEKFIAHLEKQKMSQASTMRVTVADAMRRSWTRPIAHVGHAGLSRPAVCLPQSGPAQTRPGALRLARAGGGAGGKQRARRPAGGKQNCASLLD